MMHHDGLPTTEKTKIEYDSEEVLKHLKANIILFLEDHFPDSVEQSIINGMAFKIFNNMETIWIDEILKSRGIE